MSAPESDGVSPCFVPPVMSLDAYPAVPDERVNRLTTMDSTLTQLLTALDEGRYNKADEHIRSDLTYLQAEIRAALNEMATPAEWERQFLGELPTCDFRWAWEGSDDDHLHSCRHPDDHPGRHVCKCRSWQPRDTAREVLQRAYSPGQTP